LFLGDGSLFQSERDGATFSPVGVFMERRAAVVPPSVAPGLTWHNLAKAAPHASRLQKKGSVMLSTAKHLFFLVENKEEADPSLRSG
jgi:hypothetical protein